MELLSTKQVIIRIAAIIASAEFMIMLALALIPFELSKYTEAILDVTLLVAISTPFIYTWVIKPFVKARDEALAQIGSLALTDPLTNLANRRHLLIHLERMIASSVRHKIYGALLVIDLDGFKLVNDTHGHDAGDAVLVEIAKRFVSSLRSEDVAGRMGGDEFVVLIDHIDADEQQAQSKALRIADKLIKLANIPLDFNGTHLHVGASIGICLLGVEHLVADAAISKADVAMYRAKKIGKGCAIFFD
jgi:two-component system, cell cycle response regulator